jgi:hypothetical protein
MSTFKLEVGGSCNNGADVIAVHRGSKGGVVLATWRKEYVTWVFPIDYEESTSHGNYFLYGAEVEGRPSMEDALRRANADYIARVSKYL